MMNEEINQDKINLYLKQKHLLEQFLANGNISKEQFNKSFNDLTIKMHMEEYKDK